MSNKTRTNGASIYMELHEANNGDPALKAIEVVADTPVAKKEMASVLRGIAKALDNG